MLAYGISLAALVVAVLARWLLDPVLGDTVPFVTLFGAVAAAVWLGGYRPALLVAVAGYAACHYLFIAPRGAFDFPAARDLVALLAYVMTCGIIIAFGEAARVTTRRFQDLRRRAEQAAPTIASIEAIRQRHNTRDLAVASFAITLGVLALGGILGVVNLRQLSANQQSVAHANEVIGRLESVLMMLVDAETGQRGYLLAEDDRYLEPYDAALSRLHATLLHLRNLMADSPAQLARLGALEPKITQRLELLGETMSFAKAGDHAAAVDVVLSGRGDTMMEAIRSDVAVMVGAEDELLRRWSAESRFSYQSAILSIVLPALIAIALLGIVVSVNRRNLRIRQRLADAMAEQWERLHVTLASIGDAVVTTDAQGRITYLNPVAESLTGWTQREAASRPLDDVFRIVDEQTRAPVPSPVARALADGTVVGLANHTLLIRRDGTALPIDDSAAPIRVEGGPLLGCVLVFRDVARRRKAERELYEHRESLRTTLSSIGDAVISTDAQGRIAMLNPVAERLTGWTQADAAGQPLETVFQIVNEATREPVENPAARALREGVVVGLANHTVLVRKDGTEMPIDDSAAPIRSAEGDLVGCVLVFRDVTARRQDEAEREALLGIAERARAEAEAAVAMLGRMQAIADAALLDLPYEDVLQSLVRRVSVAVGSDTCTLLLLEEDGALHVRAAKGLEDSVIARVRVPIGQGFAGGIVKERRPRIWNDVHYDDVVSDYIREKGIRALAGVPLLSADDSVLGVLHVGRFTPRAFGDEDIRILQLAAERVSLAVEHAARREAERRGRELAEASNRAKDEFLAMLGHELRNPLAAVRNAVATASLDESRRARSLDIARRQAEQLGRLIDDLLDVARITQGKIALRKERVYLTEILEHALDSTRAFIESRGLRLGVKLAPEPVRVEADPARLEQVFVNLLSNAAKYTDAGGRVDVVSQLDGDEVVIRVRDSGIGIAPDVLPRIWELFAQAERAPDRAQGGLGIGLTVARRLVDMHGGRIEAKSDGPSKGAEFIVTLPALPVAADDVRVEKVAEPMTPRAARVLLVEDNPDAAESLEMLLEVLGHRVRSVCDGMTALDAASANPPDVMLVDIGLPGMDGYEVARRIRRNPDLKHIVLVALTGYGRDEDKRRAMAAGFDYHLVKPVNPDALQGLVARLADKNPRESSTIH